MPRIKLAERGVCSAVLARFVADETKWSLVS